jgi:hypothetical protein
MKKSNLLPNLSAFFIIVSCNEADIFTGRPDLGFSKISKKKSVKAEAITITKKTPE